MEAVAVHQDMAILFIVLLVLAMAILVLAWDLLRRPRHRSNPLPRLNETDGFENLDETDNFEDVLHIVEAGDTPAPLTNGPVSKPADFVFRRHLTQPLSTPDNTAQETQPSPPPKIEFSTIQNEIRAALEQAAQTPKPASPPSAAMVSWTESGRLAVLSLGDAPPEIAWSLLQAQGIHILIVPEDHPFPPPNRTIELLCLPEMDEAAMSALIARLRAKLAKGERIAFYTEAGLTGSAALLAARLSGRTTQ